MNENSNNLGKVLILNNNYEVLGVATVEKSIVLLYLNKAFLVSALTDKLLHSSSSEFPFPSIIRLANYVKLPRTKVILSRKNILKRDGSTCSYCGTKDGIMTVDHVLPKSRGGSDDWINLTTACTKCNNKKGNNTPEEAEMILLKTPFKPNHVTFIVQSIVINPDWKPYLFMN